MLTTKDPSMHQAAAIMKISQLRIGRQPNQHLGNRGQQFRVSLFALFIACFVSPMNPTATASAQDEPPANQLPLTVAEKSDYKSTSLSSQVVEFVDQCAAQSDHVTKFVWGETVEGREMAGAIVATSPYELGTQDDRNVVLLLGNIHSGECAGKEALLMMLRELTHNPDHPWLKQNVILFAPNYNADGNDRIGKLNRRGQIGPENGMGRRENAQQLDLNRDFCKIESPEARALVALIDTANPHLFVDCHTTNGSQHQYALTYDIPHNPTTAAPIRKFLREKMMPEVTKRLADDGTLTFYYGNFNRENTQWTTYGHEPRYSTEYVGLRGRLAILSEAYSYISYKDRIFATKDFVSTLLDYSTENHESIHKLLDAVDQELVDAAKTQPERVSISLGAKVSAFPEKYTLKGIKEDEPHDYECDFVGNYEATKTTTMPYAYLVPRKFARIVDRLKMHGVAVDELAQELVTDVEFDVITELNRSERAFQKHKMVQVESKRDVGSRAVPAGTYVIPTAQPLGRFVSYMLESASDDGFVFWNFFDDVVAVDQEFPILRLPQPVKLPTKPVQQVEKVGLLDLDMIDGPTSILANRSKPPKWFGNTNWLMTKFGSREFLIDAATAGFVNRPARPFEKNKLVEALEATGLDNETAIAMADSDPIVATNSKYAVFNDDNRAFVFVLGDDTEAANSLIELGSKTEPAELFDFNEDESKLAYVTPSGLHLLDLQTKKSALVAAENADNLVGKLDWVYQEELFGRGNFKSFWWNPDGDHVAFLSLDESPVLPFTVMDHMPIRGKSEFTNYPKAGDPLPTVKLGVVKSGTADEITWVDLGKYSDIEFLISRVTWSSDGDVLLIQVQNREQTWLDLVATDREGNNPTVLFRDETPAWIESPGDPPFVSGSEFLWISPRNGHSHIYKYSLAGDLLDQLTSGDWEVRSLLGIDANKKYGYYTATKENAIDMHCYRLDLVTGESTQITKGDGSHGVKFSDDFSMFMDSHSSVETPARTILCRNDGEMIRRLNVNSDDRIDYLNLTQPEFMEIKTDDGVLLDAMLIRPPNFDANKKYPVLIHIYAGPQAPRVRNRFGDRAYLWYQMLAQKGYVVWMCDNRSASYRNVKNVWPIHRNMAANELKDIECGVTWLKDQPWVDGDRIGIWGWSYGGYMTLYSMTRSKNFKMGISGAPVTDWRNYDAIYTERYMGLPKDNEEGYKNSSVLGKAADLHGELLIIHGTIDDNVHLNNTIQFTKELQQAGKQFDMMFYPSSRHSVRDKKQSKHLRRLMTDFILENL